MNTKPFNIRLPLWALEFIDKRARTQGTTKTEVVVEALERLRVLEVEGLMRRGYLEMRELDARLAEEGMPRAGKVGGAE